MLVIRLRRIGRAHDPHYRIVVTEHTAPVQGKFLTEIGHYHPKSKELGLDEAAFMDWISKGAKPSNTVARLAKNAKLEHKHITVKQLTGKPKKKAQEAAAAKAEAAKAPKVEETAPEAETNEPVEADAPEEATEAEPEVTEETSEESTEEETPSEESAEVTEETPAE